MTRPEERDAAIAGLGLDEAASVTDAPRRCEPWRAEFAASADWVARADVRVPQGEPLVRLCETYGFPAVAVRHLAAHRDRWDEPRIRRLGAHVQWMVANRYSPVDYHRLGWPSIFSRCPLFYAYAALGLAQRVASQQAARGIGAQTTRRTLWDIGQQVYLHHRVHGAVGMNKGWWLSHHTSHHLFRLGRLQFQRGRARRALGPIPPGEPFLDVHIPEDGVLDAAGCDASLEQAGRFFADHFPDEHPRHYACTSWLLDPALTTLLPAQSNILHFQRRFELHDLRDGPSSVFEFVFDRPDLDPSDRPDLSSLPRDTRLRRAIVDHYARGATIRMGVGTIAL